MFLTGLVYQPLEFPRVQTAIERRVKETASFSLLKGRRCETGPVIICISISATNRREYIHKTENEPTD